jgi:activator of HSP90 ATPase
MTGAEGTTQAKNLATRRQWLATGALAAGTLALWPAQTLAEEPEEISHSAEAIHQEPTFMASPARVYEALMDTQQFDKVIQISGVMQSDFKAKMKKPTEISSDMGGTFALFGGYIVGRHLELVPNELIVQAWRVGSWDRGLYSIVRFELTKLDGGTKIVFDHTGFPKGDAEHLAQGWRAHYWDPMRKLLA